MVPRRLNSGITKGDRDKAVKSANPEYTKWVALGQQVLGYLLTTMTREVMAQVATAQTSAELWNAVEEISSSQTHARSVNTHIALATMKIILMVTKKRPGSSSSPGSPMGSTSFLLPKRRSNIRLQCCGCNMLFPRRESLHALIVAYMSRPL